MSVNYRLLLYRVLTAQSGWPAAPGSDVSQNFMWTEPFTAHYTTTTSTAHTHTHTHTHTHARRKVNFSSVKLVLVGPLRAARCWGSAAAPGGPDTVTCPLAQVAAQLATQPLNKPRESGGDFRSEDVCLSVCLSSTPTPTPPPPANVLQLWVRVFVAVREKSRPVGAGSALLPLYCHTKTGQDAMSS